MSKLPNGPRVPALVQALRWLRQPIAMLEALATGLPVVSTDVGEVRLVVDDGINRQISAAREPKSFADAILRGLSGTETFRGAACEQAVSKYRPEPVLENIYANHRLQGT